MSVSEDFSPAQAFSVSHAAEQRVPFVFNSPHSGRVYPRAFLAASKLDAKTLRRVRGYTHLIPGCDNGPYLGGHFSSDGALFVLEGCGGEARLDVATGKFKCGDSDGLMGASYQIVTPTHTPQRPPQAIGVPPCRAGTNASSSVTSLGAGFSMEWNEEGVALLGPKGLRIKLPENARPVVSPAGDRFAYAEDNKVFVKSLPANAALSTFEF